jgi:hypothetical protein
LDTDSFVIVEPGAISLTEETTNLESRFGDEQDQQPEESTQKPIDPEIDISEIERQEPEAPQEKEQELTPVQPDIVPEASRPTSPPQMATITIVKTMTFLEQEKINAEAMMIVTKDPLASPDNSMISQADRSLPEEIIVKTHLEPDQEGLDESLNVSQADRSLPEEVIQQTEMIEVTETSPVHSEPQSKAESVPEKLEEVIQKPDSPVEEIVEQRTQEVKF